MVKFITKTICAILITVLCSGALFAQKEKPNYNKSKSEIKEFLQTKSVFKNADRIVNLTNPNSVNKKTELKLMGNSKGAVVEGWRQYPEPWGYYIFDSENANSGEVIWDPGYDMMSGETVDGLLYAYDDETHFYIWDAKTGEQVGFFPYAIFDEDYIPNDMAYDYTTGIMYGLSWNELLIVDMETGEVDVLDIFFESDAGDALVFMAFAIDKNGNAYGVTDFWDWDIWTYEGGILFSIDLETGICERIGDTEVDIMWYYPECMVFDNNTGKLYWSHLGNAVSTFSWREIDIETGLSTHISYGAILVCLSIPFTITPPCYPASNLSVEYTDACEAILTWTAPAAAAVFNVYRDGDIIAAEITELTYLDNDFDITVGHTWTVTVVCENGESDPVDVEEDYCDNQSISRLTSKVSIYPNPAKNLVYIEGADIVKVEIYNMFGQMIDTYKDKVIDVSKFNTGMYLFKTFDANNNVVITNIMVTR